jgi:hypothetical protein
MQPPVQYGNLKRFFISHLASAGSLKDFRKTFNFDLFFEETVSTMDISAKSPLTLQNNLYKDNYSGSIEFMRLLFSDTRYTNWQKVIHAGDTITRRHYGGIIREG